MKYKIEKNTVQETLILPLYSRKLCTELYPNLYRDETAVHLIDQISALDNESELVVQTSLEKLSKGRTTFIIAHRLSTIRNADVIMVLTENGIEETGTHRELMEKKGEYYKLYNLYADVFSDQ